MVAYFCINNVAFPVARDTFRMTHAHVGELLSRSPNGGLLESSTSKNKRAIRFTSTPMPVDEAEMWTHVIHGNGHSWSFASNAYSSKGAANSEAGSYTVGSGEIAVASGSSFRAYLGDKMYSIGEDAWLPPDGYTVLFRRRNAAGDTPVDTNVYTWAMHGEAGFTRGTANPGAITQYKSGGSAYGGSGSYDMGYFAEMTAGGIVGVYGYDTSGAAGARSYLDLLVWPFDVTHLDIASADGSKRLSWLNGWREMLVDLGPPPLPAVYVTGYAVNKTAIADGKAFVGRVVDMRHVGAKLPGDQWNANNCVIDVELTEV